MRNLKQVALSVSKKLSVLAVSAVLAACAVGPDYQRPETKSPDEFVSTDATQFATADVEGDFWKAFNDEQLNSLIEEALAANHDIRIATARLREARAIRGEAQLDFAPTVTASAGQTESRGSSRQALGFARDQDYYDAGFDAFWELDFFGRIRRNVEANTALVQAAEAGVYSTQVSITAEVARNYFELRGSQQRLEVAQRNAENQRETLRITTARLDAGRGTQLDTSRAQAQLSATLATIPDFESDITRSILRLGVLTGKSPEALFPQLSAVQKLPTLPTTQNIGTPELLLRRRPDIMVAERQLASATAQIGVAVGDLFPRISFVGRWGFDAIDSGDLGKGSSESYAFGPSIQWAAFDLGRVRQQIKQREAATDRALAVYQQTVLQALEETDASMTAYVKAKVKQAHLQDSTTASLEAVTLARARYESGVADFLTVLDAERSALTAEDQLALSETQTATALLATYKALGGGFRPLDAKASL
ncbi:efflux transporter outer membrane subunit [Steroidobacter agaridevorans]|uniref:efflux transporter outer membrane subunit n=1 Tax=Steroidobacter agaridevorans TaxID=2695856 RepID=UPI0013258544|nr:efflux transporter outer membrane subunit [Steroidobacter agaridevorans]GFE91269.1 RND transporter [Steroidobacter agaridevorans]